MTGGFTGFENTKSTEIFTAGDTTWTTVGDLPRARNGLRATNVNNMIYVLGKYHNHIKVLLNSVMVCRWRYRDIEV